MHRSKQSTQQKRCREIHEDSKMKNVKMGDSREWSEAPFPKNNKVAR